RGLILLTPAVAKKPVNKVIARCGQDQPPLAAIVVAGLTGDKVAWQKTKNLTSAELRFTNGYAPFFLLLNLFLFGSASLSLWVVLFSDPCEATLGPSPPCLLASVPSWLHSSVFHTFLSLSS